MHGTRPVGPRSGGLAEKKTARALLGHRSLVVIKAFDQSSCSLGQFSAVGTLDDPSGRLAARYP